MECIYKITNPKGLIYIGKTKNVTERVKCYKYLKCKDQPRIYRSIKKYGWDNHKFEIILKTANTYNAEIKLIEYYNSFNNGLNLTPGGDGGYMNDEIKAKISRSKIGKSSHRKGTKCSVESKQLMSIAKIGRPSNSRRKISQFSLEGVFIKDWDSLTEAAVFYEILVSSISNNLKQISKHAGGYIWRFKNNNDAN